MINQMKKSIATRRRGFWFTTKTGQHIYVDEDETPKQACERVYKERSEEREKVVKPSDVDKLYGEEFKGYKGQAAIDKLLKEQRGHVKGAFHRDDIGDIDLVWGSDTAGLQHIINRRLMQGIDVANFLSSLGEAVEKGSFRRQTQRGDYEVTYNGSIAVLAMSYHDNKVQFLLTAYKTRYK